jgi:hypothetical protein
VVLASIPTASTIETNDRHPAPGASSATVVYTTATFHAAPRPPSTHWVTWWQGTTPLRAGIQRQIASSAAVVYLTATFTRSLGTTVYTLGDRRLHDGDLHASPSTCSAPWWGRAAELRDRQRLGGDDRRRDAFGPPLQDQEDSAAIGLPSFRLHLFQGDPAASMTAPLQH